MLSDFEVKYLTEKIRVHRGPHESQAWDDPTKNKLDESINNNNPQKKQVIVRDNYLKIENFEFNSFKKLVFLYLFSKKNTIILEVQFGELFAHIHITTKSKDYLEIFNKLVLWSKSFLKT